MRIATLLAALAHRGVKVLVPIVYREKLMGFFALKPKLSEEEFDRDDLLLLETLANQAATAIETAGLHDQMTQQAEFRRDLDIVRDGQAYADRRFRHTLRPQFELAEGDARKHARGLWKDVKEEQMPPWRQRWLAERASK